MTAPVLSVCNHYINGYIIGQIAIAFNRLIDFVNKLFSLSKLFYYYSNNPRFDRL